MGGRRATAGHSTRRLGYTFGDRSSGVADVRKVAVSDEDKRGRHDVGEAPGSPWIEQPLLDVSPAGSHLEGPPLHRAYSGAELRVDIRREPAGPIHPRPEVGLHRGADVARLEGRLLSLPECLQLRRPDRPVAALLERLGAGIARAPGEPSRPRPQYPRQSTRRPGEPLGSRARRSVPRRPHGG